MRENNINTHEIQFIYIPLILILSRLLYFFLLILQIIVLYLKDDTWEIFLSRFIHEN